MLNDDIPNLRELHQTLVDASELMAAFVGCAKGNEQPPEWEIQTGVPALNKLIPHEAKQMAATTRFANAKRK